MTKIFCGQPEDLVAVIRLLKEGRVVAVPTETVYGLAADALNPAACRRIFALKGRPLIDPLIVHVRDGEAAASLAQLNRAARRLMRAFWPGPLTIVLPKKPLVPDVVTASLPSVALRCPAHPLLRRILTDGDLALAAPSANPFAYLSPTSARHVLDCLGDKIEYLLDGGPCEVGLESTIVDLRRETVPRLLRPGVITPEMLAETLGAPLATEGGDTDNPSIPEISAPGQMPKHYSPSTPLSLFPAGGVPQENLAGNTALVFLKKPSRPFDSLAVQNIFWLTEQGDLPTAARNLFPLLHTLDAKGFEHIAVEKAPAPGIGLAINDRLTRAARR